MRLRSGIWAACVAAAVASGCNQGDSGAPTRLVVRVTGSVTGIRQLHASLSDGAMTGGVLDVPTTPTAITLPASFSVEFTHKVSGALRIQVDARNETMQVIASGLAMVAVPEGQTTEVEVKLAEKGDAGADAGDGGADGLDVPAGSDALDGTPDGDDAGVGGEGGSEPAAEPTPDAAVDAATDPAVDAVVDGAVDPAIEPAFEAAVLANGSGCSSGGACASGFCVDAVCCDVVCTDACNACSNARTGLANGVCGAVSVGGADGRCASTAASGCDTDGTCDGSGACRKWPVGTVCVPEACTSAVHQPQRTCNGTGTCVAAATNGCTPYACGATNCLGSCSTSADCATGFWCNGAVCESQKSDGTVCTADDQCSNAHCVESVCCDAACTAACNSCSNAKTGQADGMCQPITSGQADIRCGAASAPSTCGLDGACDGLGLCRKWGASTVCVPESCAGTTHQPQRNCDGAGLCVAAATNDCGLFACGSPTCLLTCSTSADCSGGAFCMAPTCAPQKTDGSVCTTDEQCANGHCLAGFCCPGAGSCAGACEVCSGVAGACQNAAVGGNPKGTCSGAYLCGGGAACATACVDDSTCAGTHYCSGVACVPRKPDGDVCAGSNECSNGHCTAGFCCPGPASCPGTCEICSGPAGACRPAAAQSDPKAACLPTFTCSGTKVTCATSCVSDADCAGTRICAMDGTCAVAVKVNPALGDDAGACGTGSDPDCRSLTHALVQNATAKAFALAAGAYGADETFPISLTGVVVIGPATALLTATANVSALVQATGAASRLSGISLSGGSSTVGSCLVVAGSQRVDGVEVRNCTDGVLAQSGTPALTGVIAQSNSNGVHVVAGKPVLRGCVIGDPLMTSGNTAIGLAVDAGGADVDLVAGGAGSNVLRANVVADLRYSGVVTLTTTGTTWDASPPTCHVNTTPPPVTADIWVDNFSGIVLDGVTVCSD